MVSVADIRAVRTPGLGDTTYVSIVAGEAIVVDPQRDYDRFLAVCEEAGAQPRFVLETHIHNDYVSGGLQLARNSGAELVLPAGSGAAFPFTPAFHGEGLVGAAFQLRPIHTPGHTPEHMSYVLMVDGADVAVFSGGSLLVGSAGRTDLLGQDRAEQLARLQYQSVNRLAALDAGVGLYPTHGEGSFCTSSGAGRHTSTIGEERRASQILSYPDEDAFVAGQLAGLGPYPSYYAHMAPINVAGPALAPTRGLAELAVEDIPAEAKVVDVRPRERFAGGHVPGSLGIPTSDETGVWAGWLLPFDAQVVIVADRGQDVDEFARQFTRIGFDHIVGVVYDLGGAALSAFSIATDADLAARIAGAEKPQILDVRSPSEFESFHLDGSFHRYVPDIDAASLASLDPDQEVWVVCASGHRATIAAGLIERAGFTPVLVGTGGVASTMATLRQST